MRMLRFRLLAVALCMAIAGCDCDTPPGTNTDGGGSGGNSGAGGGGPGGNSGSGGASGSGDGGRMVDPTNLDNDKKDSDCDGLSDADEFGNTYPGGMRTSPTNPDTDGDGIRDGVEAGKVSSVDPLCVGFVGDQDLNTRTNPTNPDSDGDGLRDGLEDKNQNGRVDANETDATNPDSDFDGLADGAEDANKNGAVDTGETDPSKRDTDGDFINDGVEKSTTMTDPTRADTDGDTCFDGNEDFNQNGVVDMGETNPNLATDCGPSVNPDTDNDGLPNRFEDRDGDGVVDPGETDPNNPDTDGDGIRDGVEDANKNGAVDVGETNPLRRDSDCDGLLDGPDTAMLMGEDQNADGQVQATESDPRRRDTDGDGITDGVERGLSALRIAGTTNCTNGPVDLDPTTTTDPTRRDSDGDGIDDGAEDTNQNGRVDTGELDPRNMSDGTGPAGQVCTAMNLRPVTFRAEGTPDIQLGLPATFTEISTMTSGGQSRGLIGWDPTNRVAFIAWRMTAPGMSATADEAAIATQLGMVGALSNPTVQAFTSWDGVGAAQAFYAMAGNVDIKNRANQIATSLVGSGAGVLAGAGGTNGPFQLQVEYLHRINPATLQRFTVVIIAMRPSSVTAEGAMFTMSDTAGGSAVAQFGDANAIQCETFKPSAGKVDFLFVVDDSCSMEDSQTALGNAATAMAAALNNSTLDYRLALVSSEYHLTGSSNNRGVRRGFTTNINQFRSWLTEGSTCSGGNCSGVMPVPPCDSNGAEGNGTNGGCWIDIDGSGTEGLLGAARKATDDIMTGMPADGGVAVNKMRSDATLVIVLLGDADDQTSGYTTTGGTLEAVNNFVQYFQGTGTTALTRNPQGRNIPVHGIVCPAGQNCNNESQSNPQRHAQVIVATGGIRGAINNAASITTSINAIVTSTIGAAGYRMQKPPIGASVKVAMDTVLDMAMCNRNDIPRSRVNGFDFDGVNRTISFFGACRPGSGTMAAAVSYRYWVDTTPNQGGNPPPCSMDAMYYDPTDPDFCRGRLQCNQMTNICECPSNCGGTAPPGKVCNPNPLVCDFVCTSDCGGTCNGFQICNVTDCSCECVQSATCAPGYRFQNGAGVCGCVCDTAQLGCGATYDADPSTCSCACKPGCGGCGPGLVCNPSTCVCGIGSPG
ncbi:MAG: VWA domain-containing protein [Myxococcaceae bacterium]|nr:VWA domain-containing protein [Myxococcaceae bacterium]